MASSPSCSSELPLPHDCACSCSSELPHSRDCASPWPPPRCHFRAGIHCRPSSRPSPPSPGTSSSPRTPAPTTTAAALSYPCPSPCRRPRHRRSRRSSRHVVFPLSSRHVEDGAPASAAPTPTVVAVAWEEEFERDATLTAASHREATAFQPWDISFSVVSVSNSPLSFCFVFPMHLSYSNSRLDF
jgi:hypothetical protein